MGSRWTKSVIKDYLIIQPIELGFGGFLYYVETPENEVMHFKSKREAKSFIEFYKRYKQKYPERFKQKPSLNNTVINENLIE